MLSEHQPHALTLLDEATRSRGVDPATATLDMLLTIGGTLASLALVRNEGVTLRRAEMALVRNTATPTQVQRALNRAKLIPVPENALTARTKSQSTDRRRK